MTAVLLGSFEVETPEWHAARATGLGGSEVAALLGLSRFESYFSLWARKKGLVPPQPENDEMRAGKLLEPVILQRFRDEHPWLSVDSHVGTHCHDERPWQIANPDGVAYLLEGPGRTDTYPTPRIVECKFSLYGDDFGADGSDEIPPYYACQVQWYMDVFSASEAWVEVFIGARGEFRTYRVPANAEDQALLRDKAAEFLALLASDEQPPLDGTDVTYETVRRMHPLIDGSDLEVDEAIVRDYLDADQALKDAKTSRQFTAARLMQAMGTARYATVAGDRLVRREAKGDDGTPYLKACPQKKAKAA